MESLVCCGWQLRLVRLVGIMLVIFVRDVLYDLVQECSAQSVGTGLLGMMVRNLTIGSKNIHFPL